MNEPTSPRPVVVAVAKHQPDLLRFATGMAELLDAPLRVVHAQGSPPDDTMRTAAQRVLDEARGHVGVGASRGVDYVIRSEPSAYVIQAESNDAALVVLGADDVAALEQLAGQGVTEGAALHSSSPILVVPPRTAAPRLTQIVVGIDVDNPVEDAIGFALGIADRTGAKVQVVSVIAEQVGVEERAWHERRLHGHVRRWSTAFPGVGVRTDLLVGIVDRELARAAQRAELVVVGHPTQPHPDPLFSRPVAAAILRSARFTVAVVPEGSESPS